MADEQINEIEAVQNAAIGAALVWRQGLGYQAEASSRPIPLPLTFLVLPICLHKQTLEFVSSTNKSSGLTLFAAKIGRDREGLFAIHSRALLLRNLTLASLSVGAKSGLLSVDYATAAVRANTQKPPFVPERIKVHLNAAEKLGTWFGRMPMEQVAAVLKVEF
jgi:hypothetical protein